MRQPRHLESIFLLGDREGSEWLAYEQHRLPPRKRPRLTGMIETAEQFPSEDAALEARRELPKHLQGTLTTVWPAELYLDLDPDGEIRPNEGVSINLNAHMDMHALLAAFETARVVLGDRERRGWVLDKMDLADFEADDTWRRLTSLMNEVRSTQRGLPAGSRASSGRLFPTQENARALPDPRTSWVIRYVGPVFSLDTLYLTEGAAWGPLKEAKVFSAEERYKKDIPPSGEWVRLDQMMGEDWSIIYR